MRNLDAFFAYAQEREKIRLRREQGRAPGQYGYTDDPILGSYRFCNIFREDDKVTRWIRERITLERYQDRLLGAMVIARWFNRIETLEKLYWDPSWGARAARLDDLLSCWGDTMEGWAWTMREVLGDVRPLVTSAYMVKTPAKMNKLEGLIWCLERILPDAQRLQASLEAPGDNYLEGTTEVLAQYPYLGPFMAYEIVTDLRHTPLLADAPDIMTWANPGPGATRGLARVLGVPLDTYNRHKPEDVKLMQVLMRRILEASQDPANWPWPDRPWEMREVEHTLCEFDKYERARLGEGSPKNRYRRT